MKKIFMAILLFIAGVYAESACAYDQKLYVYNSSNWSFTLDFSLNGKHKKYQFSPQAMLEIGPISSITSLDLEGTVVTTSMGGILGSAMREQKNHPEKDVIIEVEAGTLGWIFKKRWEAISKGFKDPYSKTLPVTRHKK